MPFVMERRATLEDPARSGARMLDRAEGVLMALRRCTVDAAFDEIVSASKRHRVPTLSMAHALVSLAAKSAHDDEATAAARYEWGSLLDQARR
ncbi:ANTAR domain-containing protein [Mycobacterium sp.]|uniref:ANTAR domain-containing protein n=1 Tax=Mycobacterium sp. TaxID=1785 RepID=UPI002D939B21|nr:ANTAR domain-containing protein [Mycobacterium sp.]